MQQNGVRGLRDTLNHTVGSFVEIFLTRQEIVLGEVRIAFSFSAASIFLQSWQLLASGEGLLESCCVMARIILACPSFLKLVSVRDKLVLHTHQFIERRHDFQRKGTTRNVPESRKQ